MCRGRGRSACRGARFVGGFMPHGLRSSSSGPPEVSVVVLPSSSSPLPSPPPPLLRTECSVHAEASELQLFSSFPTSGAPGIPFPSLRLCAVSSQPTSASSLFPSPRVQGLGPPLMALLSHQHPGPGRSATARPSAQAAPTMEMNHVQACSSSPAALSMWTVSHLASVPPCLSCCIHRDPSAQLSRQ